MTTGVNPSAVQITALMYESDFRYPDTATERTPLGLYVFFHLGGADSTNRQYVSEKNRSAPVIAYVSAYTQGCLPLLRDIPKHFSVSD